MINKINDAFDLQLAVEEARDRNLEFKIVVKTKGNVVPSIRFYRKGIVDKIIIQTMGKDTKKVVIDGELLKDKLAKKDLKELLENNKFHTFGGIYDVAALLTEDIYLNIYMDWCPDNRTPYREGLDVKDIDKAMENKAIKLIKEGLAFERGKAFYFGLKVDENLLEERINLGEFELNETREELAEELGLERYDDDNLILNTLKKLIPYGNKLRALKVEMTYNKSEDVRNTAYKGYWFLKRRNKLIRLKQSLKHVTENRITLININNSVHDALFEKNDGGETIVRPRKGYSLITLGAEDNLGFKAMDILKGGKGDKEDYIRHSASETFGKDLNETLDEDRSKFKKLYILYLTRNIKTDMILRDTDFKDYSDEEYLYIKNKVFSYLDSLKSGINVDISKSHETIQDALEDIGNVAELIEPRGLAKITKAVQNYYILKLQEHFGKYNFRIRYLGGIREKIIYEVVSGEVEEFTKQVEGIKVSLGEGALKLELKSVLSSNR